MSVARGLVALMVWGMLSSGASASVFGSAQITPNLVVAHVELALVKLRQAQRGLTSTRAGGEAIALNLSTTRQALYDAAQELGSARMATMDPDEETRLNALLAQVEAIRFQLEVRVDQAIRLLADAQQDALALRTDVQGEIDRREDVVSSAKSP